MQKIDINIKDDYITVALVNSNLLSRLIYKGRNIDKALQSIDNYKNINLNKINKISENAKAKLLKLIQGEKNETVY